MKSSARRALIVLGTHRSGTSLTAALLCKAGAAAPRHLQGADENNETGYWEPWTLQQFQDEVLAEMGASWDTPQALPVGFFSSPASGRFKERLADVFRDEYGDAALFCTKDPRASRLLPMWLPVLDAEGIDASYVIVTRNPLEVAHSLKSRDGLHWSQSVMVWLRHTLEAEEYTRGRRRVFVGYDEMMENWRAVLARISERLEIAWPRRDSDIDVDFDRIIADRLRHHRVDFGELEARGEVVEWVADAYRGCLEAERDREQQAIFDRVRHALATADKAFEPLLVIEKAAGGALLAELTDVRGQCDRRAARVAELEGELTAIRSAEASSRSEANALRAELDGVSGESARYAARVSQLEAEVTAIRSSAASIGQQLDSLKGEAAAAVEDANRLRQASEQREAQIAGATAQVQSDVSALRAELDGVNGESARHAARVADLEAELTAMRNDAASSHAWIEDLEAQFELARSDAAATGQERDSLQEELAKTNQASREQAVCDAALQGEVSALRAELDGVSGESARHAARVAELETELTAMRNEAASIGQEVDSLKGEAAAAVADANRLRQELDQRETQMAGATARAQSEVSALRAELDGVNGESARHAARVAELEAELTAMRSDATAMCRERDSLREDLAKANEASQEHAVRSAALQSEVAAAATAAHDAHRLRRALEHRDAQIAEMRNALLSQDKAFRGNIESVRSEVSLRAADLRETRTALLSAEGRIASTSAGSAQLRAELALSIDENAELQDQLSAVRSEFERLCATQRSRDREVERLREELRARYEQREDIHRELNDTRLALSQTNDELAAAKGALNGAYRGAATTQARIVALQANRQDLLQKMSERDAALAALHDQRPSGSVAIMEAAPPAHGLCDIALWRVDIDAISRLHTKPNAPIGVFVHIYYEEIAGEIAAALKNIPYEFRVYVSTANVVKKSLIEAEFARQGVAVSVKILPNAGRDIGPFIFGFREEIRSHDICLRLHSKKSTHGDPSFGIAWRRFLLDELVGDAERATIAVETFLSRPDIGMVIPQHWPGVSDWLGVGDNWPWLEWLLERMELSADREQFIDYPCGAMFWFRSAAMEPLLALELTPEDFAESSEENRDASLAHGFERGFLFSAARAGLRWGMLPAQETLVEPGIDEATTLVRDSGLFDAAYYLATNQDVADGGDEPLEHFMLYGHQERRNPSADFNARHYARIALREFGWTGNPLVHYILEGKAKGLSPQAPPSGRTLPAVVVAADIYAPYKKAEHGAEYVPETFPLIRRSDVKLMAFYFPQFHPFDENDRFWGRGFTEWTNVTKAHPMFPGHYQPRLPGELGFYDTRVKAVLERQIELAKQFGIHGFCFHHYFFDGKPVMRAPYNHMLASPDLDIPFCLHWANEPWTVRWDGLASESGMLLDQHHTPKDDYAFFDDIAPALTDKRYITIDGRPLLVVYRPGIFPDMRATIERWRERSEKLGLKQPYLAVMQAWFEGAVDPRRYGFDAAIEYPPHNLPDMSDSSGAVSLYDRDFEGTIRDYRQAAEKSLAREKPEYTWFRGIMPEWDCTPRRSNPDLFVNCSPKTYEQWLQGLCAYTGRSLPQAEQFVFINSWNEWAEGAYLEPDRRYGYAYLDATAKALNGYDRPRSTRRGPTLLLAAHLFYLDLLDEFLDHFAQVPGPFDVYLTVVATETAEIEARVRARLGRAVVKVTVRSVGNVGRDGAPFLLHALPESQNYDVCCWTHSKKSPYNAQYKDWRGYLLDNLLGAPASVSAVLDTFAANPKLGVLFPKPFPAVRGKVEWGSNFQTTADLLSRLDIRVNESDIPIFPPGMMFWFRPEALRRMVDFELGIKVFADDLSGVRNESGIIVDGTVSHAIERSILYVAKDAGFAWQEFLDSPYKQAREL